MATPLNPKDDSTGTGEGAQGPQTTTTGGSTDASGTGQGATDQVAQSNTTTPQATDVGKVSDLNQGFDWNPVMDFVKGYGTKANAAIDTANQGFNQQLGTFNPFGAQDQTTLQQVLQGKQDLSVGQGLLNKQYGGPTAIDRTQYDPQVAQYGQYAGQTGSAAGLGALLGQMNPGLNEGERANDALIFGNNTGFQQASRDAISGAAATQQRGDQTAGDALSAINQRKTDIGGFNTAAKGYVTSQKDSINNAIKAQIAAGQQHSQQAQDAIAALKGGTKTFADFDPSLFGFNTSQYGPQTLSVDQKQYTVPQGTFSPGMQFAAGAMTRAGFPGGYPTPTQTALMAPGAFSQTLNPAQYLQYKDTPLTRETAATPEQSNQYNIAEQLLNEQDRLTGTGGAGLPQIGINTGGWQQALQQAQGEQAKVEQQDKDWLAQWSAMPKAVGQGWTYQIPQGGIPVDSAGKPLTQQQVAAAQQAAQQLSNPMATLMAMQGNPAAVQQWYAGGGAEGGGGPSSAEVSGQAGGAFAAGGIVKPPKPKLKVGAKANPLASMGSYSLGAPPQQAQQQQGPQQGSSSVLNPIGQMSYQAGGPIPMNAGTPGVQDSVPVLADAGEFVTRKNAVDKIGHGNMHALNQLDRAAPGNQSLVRNALHSALTKAALKRVA